MHLEKTRFISICFKYARHGYRYEFPRENEQDANDGYTIFNNSEGKQTKRNTSNDPQYLSNFSPSMGKNVRSGLAALLRKNIREETI